MKRAAIILLLMWAVVLAGGAALLSLGCTSAPRGAYSSPLVRAEHEAAVSLRVTCRVPALDHAAVVFLGSGAAVGANRAVTARHVVDCVAGPLVGVLDRIEVTRRDGASATFVPESVGLGEDDDIAVLLGPSNFFAEWAEVADEDLRIGDVVCAVAAEPLPARSCGEVTALRGAEGRWMGAGYALFQATVVPGNSGGAAYDARGRVAAIVVARAGGGGGIYLASRWRWRVP